MHAVTYIKMITLAVVILVGMKEGAKQHVGRYCNNSSYC